MRERDHTEAIKRVSADGGDSLRSGVDDARVTKQQLRTAIELIAREDAEILEALGRGPLDTGTSNS